MSTTYICDNKRFDTLALAKAHAEQVHTATGVILGIEPVPNTFNGLRLGDRVKFLVPAGIGRHGQEWAEKTGKVALAFGGHVVVNGGGRFGTPYVVNERNFLSAKRSR